MDHDGVVDRDRDGTACENWPFPFRRTRGRARAILSHMFDRKPASVSAAEGARAAEEGRVVVYWRRGCPYCKRLELRLGRRVRDVVWVDVWADAEASTYIKSVNHGNEVVPTVVINGTPHTNPAPRLVLAALS